MNQNVRDLAGPARIGAEPNGTMYLLMSAFHAVPWLKLIRGDARTV